MMKPWPKSVLFGIEPVSDIECLKGLEPWITEVDIKQKFQKNRFWNLSNLLFIKIGYGGPTSIFLEHLSTDKLIFDLILLRARLVELGIEYIGGQVRLADLDEIFSNH